MRLRASLIARVSVAAVLIGTAAFAVCPADAASPYSWSSPTVNPASGAIGAAECPSLTLCLVTDASGGVITSTNPAAGPQATWTRAAVATSPIDGVACRLPAFCVATDEAGDVLVSSDPAGGAPTWRTVTPPSFPAGSGGGIACAPFTLCVAFQGARVTATRDPRAGAGAWTAPAVIDGENALTAISCPASNLCVAADDDGNVLTTTDPVGGTWSAPTPVDPGFAILALSCVSNLCVGTDDSGQVVITGRLTDGSSSGRVYRVDGARSIGSVACVTTTSCIAGDEEGSVLALEPGQSPFGSRWSSVDVTPGHELVATACHPSGLCIAWDDEGRVATGLVTAPRLDGLTASVQYASYPYVSAETGLTSNGALVDCHLEYGPDTTYGRTAPCTPLPSGGTRISARATMCLLDAKPLHLRMVASNAGGTGYSPDAVVTTPADGRDFTPAVGPALDVTTTTARLTADVVRGDCGLTFHFEIGPTIAYGSRTAEQTVPGDVRVATDVGALRPATVYHVRVVTTRLGETRVSPDATFTSAPPAPVLTHLSLAPVTFRAATRGATVARSPAMPLSGATLAFRLNVAARVDFAVVRRARRPRVVGTFTVNAKGGRTLLRFSGRLRNHALPAASYELRALPRGALRPSSTRFRIVAAPKRSTKRARTAAAAPHRIDVTRHYPNRGSTHLTTARVKAYAGRALHSALDIQPGSALVICGVDARTRGSCDFLLGTRDGDTWCGLAKVAAHPKTVTVRLSGRDGASCQVT